MLAWREQGFATSDRLTCRSYGRVLGDPAFCSVVLLGDEPWPSEWSGASSLPRKLQFAGAREPSRLPATATVRPRDELQQVAARVLKIDAASAVVTVDLICLGLRGVGPMRQALVLHAGQIWSNSASLTRNA